MTFRKALTQREEDELVEVYLSCDSTALEIAEQFGVSVPTVNRIVRRRGYSGAKCPKISEETRKEIIDFYLEGNNWMDTAYKYGVHEDSVINILKRAGIDRRPFFRRKVA